MKFKRKKDKDTGILIELTPLIDVVFLLLIFFMLTSTFILQPGFKINLPEAVTSDYKSTENLYCYITEDGLVYINDRLVDMNSLHGVLTEELNSREDKTLSIKGDYSIKFGLAIRVTDIARLAGVENIIYATRPMEQAGE